MRCRLHLQEPCQAHASFGDPSTFANKEKRVSLNMSTCQMLAIDVGHALLPLIGKQSVPTKQMLATTSNLG